MFIKLNIYINNLMNDSLKYSLKYSLKSEYLQRSSLCKIIKLYILSFYIFDDI